MKRFFTLYISLFVTIFGAMALDIPGAFPGLSFRGFSPDGNWVVSDDGNHSPLSIINLSDNNYYNYVEEYAPGNGNFISNTGVVVGSSVKTDEAAYWKNGEWNKLNQPQNTIFSYCNGVTPDGNRIVGSIAPNSYSGDFEGIMLIPCYWDLKSDGTYDDPVMLPYPPTDFTNRKPQYVTAVVVSADGKTIAGQITDFTGFVCQPVLYKQDEQGNWSYSQPVEQLFHPEGLELPEDPGYAPEPEEFMTPQEKAEYSKAVMNWELTGQYNGDDYPDAKDYMDSEAFMDFLDADYNWTIKYMEYSEVLAQLIEIVPPFSFNNIFMNPEATYMATTSTRSFKDEIRDIFIQENEPFLINLTDNTYRSFPPANGENIMISSLLSNGAVLGRTLNADYRIFNGYILKAGASEFIPIYDLVKETDPELGDWMKKNMTHVYDAFNQETQEIYQDSILATGIPVSTPDGTLIGFGQYVFWDEEYDVYGYLISLPAGAKVEELIQDTNSDGMFRVFNLQGVKVLETKDGSALKNLTKGLYIINGRKVIL